MKILATCILSVTALFGKPTQVQGTTQYGDVTVEAIEGSGIVKLRGTKVGRIQLTGNLLADDADIGTFDITGAANLTDTKVANPSKMMGYLQAKNCTFEDELTILNQKATFTNTKLDKITVEKDAAFRGKQLIELKQNSLANGLIRFEGGNGEVVVYPGSQVLDAVRGGKVVKSSP